MAQHRRRGFPSITMPWLAELAVTTALTMLYAASTTTAQPQTLPLPQPVPVPQPTTTASAPAAPAVPSQLPAPCPPAQATLAPCLRFFTGNSSSWSPPAECCAQIRAMFQSQAPCLCAAMASGPAAQLGGLGSALGQLLPTSCDLPADACSSGTTATGGGAPAGPSTPATGSGGATTAAAAAPEAGPAGADTTTVPGAGGAGVKSVPGLLDTGAAAAPGTPGVSAAAAVFMSLLGVYLLATLDRIMHC
ncbi:unnamed protein product [Urochloa decumbens]|uniref:Bifunctional inhibitor/plant lipid transfer protein/seed storage helical domain-containing protein n=1 Tax=Urochloa decumbens TaxID=240449 RepID=A0ABC8YJ57_9POAL